MRRLFGFWDRSKYRKNILKNNPQKDCIRIAENDTSNVHIDHFDHDYMVWSNLYHYHIPGSVILASPPHGFYVKKQCDFGNYLTLWLQIEKKKWKTGRHRPEVAEIHDFKMLLTYFKEKIFKRFCLCFFFSKQHDTVPVSE